MYVHVLTSLISGCLQAIAATWWLLLGILGAKFGPRMVRGLLMRRGGLQ